MKRAKGWMYQNKIILDPSIFDDECSDDADATEDSSVHESSRDDPGHPGQQGHPGLYVRHSTPGDSRGRRGDVDAGSMLRHPGFHADSGGLVYCCHLCPATFASRFHFTLHLAEHSDVFTDHLVDVQTSPRHPKCLECGYMADSRADLREHRLRHEAERRYVCLHCSMTFSSVHCADSHLLRRHPQHKRQVLDRTLLHQSLRHLRQKAVVIDADVVIENNDVYNKIITEETRNDENTVTDIGDDMCYIDYADDAYDIDYVDTHSSTDTSLPGPSSVSDDIEERFTDERSKNATEKITLKIRQPSKHSSSLVLPSQLLEMGKQLGTTLLKTHFNKSVSEQNSEQNSVKIAARRDRSPGGS